jgi:uncharacterized protein YndB with AHSA1/START domain
MRPVYEIDQGNAMKFLKRFILLVLLVVLALIGIGYVLPDKTHVERDIVIEAPPEAVFLYVNNFRKFNEWSPWAAKDPGMTMTFDGPESGVGARIAWESETPEVGSGSNLITESRPPNRMTSRLDFGEHGTATAYFDIKAVDAGSHVTWGFDTDLGTNLIWRYVGLMMNRWVGADYEQGLQNLKILVEKEHG